MTKKVRALLITSGLIIFLSWAFRFYVLFTRWGTDRFSMFNAFIALIFFSIGLFLLWMVKQDKKLIRRDYTILIVSAIFTLFWWGNRWQKVWFHPENDPNPRPHLHLASLYLVMGALLLLTGWMGRKKLAQESKNRD
ncbi:hypothetical protein MNBD_NITROSPIRAE01-1299 [hydrothermal vent metagenome]|uniref:Uncharacterized protein n=1 Tax=hydrothermal vent metagenome TaxID=652676 RepID=A0A3B1D5D3_9ZZZZ|nr:hypothetical protein [Candidatus Manganitrophaceae bacterium]